MEFEQVIRRRRMTRSFQSAPLEPHLLDEILDLARRAPSAGNTASAEFLVLEGSDTARYWDTTLPAARRDGFNWPGLLFAPALIVVWVNPSAYLSRYAEADKRHAGLGSTPANWPVPYWFVDGGATVMTILGAAVDRGLGALFFGLFEHEQAVRRAFGIPESRRAVGTVALGLPASDDRPSKSSRRPRPDPTRIVHRGHWQDSDTGTDPDTDSDSGTTENPQDPTPAVTGNERRADAARDDDS